MNNDGAPDATAGTELLDFIVSAYGTMRDRWSAAFAEKDCDPDAPWSALLDRAVAETAPVTGAELLLWNAEETAVVAAIASDITSGCWPVRIGWIRTGLTVCRSRRGGRSLPRTPVRGPLLRARR